jgi:hypothetical protein
MNPFSIACLIAALAMPYTQGAQVVYFLIAPYPWPRDASAVIPLSEPDQISHARDLVAQVSQGTDPSQLVNPWPGIITQAGSDGINRNYQDPTLPEWSWHVSKVVGFGTDAIPELWTTLTNLESGYAKFPDKMGTNWAVPDTVVRELGPLPLYLSAITAGQNLQLYWATPGTNYLYTVESTASLSSSNWIPLPGTAWPVTTNFWSGQVPAQPRQFYRVKAVMAAQKLVDSAAKRISRKIERGAD